MRARNTAFGNSGTVPDAPGEIEFTSTLSEEQLNVDVLRFDQQPRIRRKKRNMKNRNLIIFLAVTTSISALLFLSSFKIIHSSRPAEDEHISPTKKRKHRKKRKHNSLHRRKDNGKKNGIEKNDMKKDNSGNESKKNPGTTMKTIEKSNSMNVDTAEKIIEKIETTDLNTAYNGNNATTGEIPTHEAFEVTESKYMSTHQSTVHIYKHKRTQAQFMAYVPKDETLDKVFGISFRTKPTSNNGVAHILEHSVLCGSKQYPAKDPFVILKKGSLSTFLNAITYNDRTVYPVASLNKKDFQNLMSVYLDAVFAPKCVTEEGDWVLKQEGWRYDVDEDENLSLKGIVYSEMKGVYSNPLSQLSRVKDKFLFKNNTYHFDSGGEPASIPTLTQEEFVDFYNTHYHPSNSQSFVSGTVEDVINAMEAIDWYMKEYEYKPELKKNSAIEYQKKSLSQRLYEKIPYAVQKVDESQGQHMFSMTWLLNDAPLTPDLRLALYVLNYLLVGSSSAPLVKSLSESSLGKSVIGGGLSTGLLQSTFSIGMKGVKETNVAHVEALIFQVLNDIVRDGFTTVEIEAAVNVIEFELRDVHSSSTPAGIEIFLLVLSRWNYDQNPLDAIEYESALAGLKKAITEKQSGYFVGIIESYLLQNNHRVHMELSPDESLAEQMIKEEKEKVQYFQANLKPPEFNAIKEKALHLKQVQETSDPPSVVDSIPHLEISDMDPSGAEYDLDVIKDAYRSSTMLTKHVAHGSNGIAYIDVGIDVSRLDYNDMQLLPFVVSMLHENDSKTYTRQDLDTMIGMHTGGITIGLEILPVFEKGQTDFYASDNKKIRSILFFRGKCIAENTSHLLSLIKELAQNGLPVTKDKAIQILERKISGYKASMSSRGHSFSVKRLRSRYGTESFLLDKLSGIRQLQYLNSILDIANSEWEVVESKISNVMKSFSEMRSTDTIINLTGDTETLERIDGNVEDFVKTLKNDSNIPNLHNFHEVDHPWMEQGAKERSDMALDNEGIPISSRVSYVGEGGLLFDEGEKIGGGNAVAMQYLKKGYLWEKVRAKNGAYGVAAAMGQTDGTIFMVSYRDPQLYETISIYDEAGNYLKDELGKNSITEQAVRTAIIGSIGSLNASSLPPGKAGWLAFRRYLGGSTKVLRQKWRDEILSTTLSDFEDFAKRLQAWKNKSIAVLASESAIAEAGKKIPFEILNV